jgi:hypothetical protein
LLVIDNRRTLHARAAVRNEHLQKPLRRIAFRLSEVGRVCSV